MGSHICQECGGTYVAAPGGYESHVTEEIHINTVMRKRQEAREAAEEERSRFPVITVHRRAENKRRGMPWPLKGDKVTYEDAEGTFELRGVRAVATQLEVGEAQRVVVTFLGQLEIVYEEDTEQ